MNEHLLKKDMDEIYGTADARYVNNKYPEKHWFHVYADGSYMVDWVNTDAGMFSDLFYFYAPVRYIGLAFAREVVAILLALTQPDCMRDMFTHAVILKDKTCHTSSR